MKDVVVSFPPVVATERGGLDVVTVSVDSDSIMDYLPTLPEKLERKDTGS